MRVGIRLEHIFQSMVKCIPGLGLKQVPVMDKIIGVTELQRKFRSVFDEVVRQHVPYILTRGSRPEEVLIPYDHYIRFMRADEAGVLQR